MSMGSIWHEGEARSMSAMVLPFNASSPGSAAASVGALNVGHIETSSAAWIGAEQHLIISSHNMATSTYDVTSQTCRRFSLTGKESKRESTPNDPSSLATKVVLPISLRAHPVLGLFPRVSGC
ncbi:hypothetical protein RJZ57_006893 [Blastomyces gilchristii]